MKRKSICSLGVTLLLVCGAGSINAQDIHFSQFYENAILRNPALTGIFSGDYKAGVNYRTQWSNISVPFQTVLASAETRVAVNGLGDYVSFGATATYDHAGTISFNSMQVYPAINYNKAMADGHRSYLSIGFTGGYIQRSYDLSKATYSSQYSGGYDPLRSSGENMQNVSMQYFDAGAGMSFNSTIGEARMVTYYLGAAAYHISKPKQTFAGDQDLLRLDMKWNGNLGVRASFNEQYSLVVHMNYTMQGHYKEIIGGGLVGWRTRNTESNTAFAIYAGAFLRVKDAIIPTVKVDYNKYSITMSYDYNTSTLKPATNGTGGYEMSLFIRGNYKHKQRVGGNISCPTFEQMLDNSSNDF